MRALASWIFLHFVAFAATAASSAEPATGAAPQLEGRYPERRSAFPEGVTGLADVVYFGAFENWPRVLASLAARGYVVASVNYRLSWMRRSAFSTAPSTPGVTASNS